MNRVTFEAMGKITFAILLAVLCVSAVPALAVTRCDFDYTAHVRDEIVIPAAEQVEGQFTRNWDFSRPGITENKGNIELIFIMRGNYLDPPNLLVVLDPCTLKVRGVHELSPWVTGVPKNAHQ